MSPPNGDLVVTPTAVPNAESPQSVAIVYSPNNDMLERTKETLILPHDDDVPQDLHHLPQPAWSVLPASLESQRTRNPIRAVVDPIMAEYRNNSNNNNNNNNKSKEGNTKELISLALGDPTASGNFEPCPIVQQAALKCAQSVSETAGYVNALGTNELREAIARFHSSSSSSAPHSSQAAATNGPKAELLLPPPPPLTVDPDHVVVASGCSGALDLVLRALLDPDTFLLVPNPGFPLYQVICESMGAHVIPYNLIPPSSDGNDDNEWHVDLEHVQRLVESHAAQKGLPPIRGMVVNNPSNPTGIVYPLQHLQDIVATCQRCRLPIVADEIYGDLTYLESRPFVPLAQVASAAAAALPKGTTTVPVITCSGLGKQFLVPGWRVGWAVFHDNDIGSLRQVEQGTKQLAQIVLGASHPAQAMAVTILKAVTTAPPPPGGGGVDADTAHTDTATVVMAEWQSKLKRQLRDNAQLLQSELRQAPGLVVGQAQGAMYVMVTLRPNQFDFLCQQDDGDGPQTTTTTTTTAGEQWSARLLQEEAVFALPGSCFGVLPNAVRLVFCIPQPTLQQASRRIVAFCKRHHVGPSSAQE